MARMAFKIKLGQSLGEGSYSTSGSVAASAVAASIGTLQTDVAAAVAALVADGASPTQAHVTTLNTKWGLLLTAINVSPNLVVDVDTAVVTTQNALRAALREAMKQVAASGLAVA